MLDGLPVQSFDGPLYQGGRRRPGANQWGYDPYAPVLEPARVQTRRIRHPVIRRAYDHWGRETFENRNQVHPELLKRYKGRRSKRKGTDRVMAPPRTRKRGDRTSLHHRFARFILSRADFYTGEVGRWQGGVIVSYRLEELAAGVGCSRSQVVRLIEDFVSAGSIYRRQGREPNGSGWKGKVAVLKVTELMWERSEAAPLRQAAKRRRDQERQQRNQAAAGELADRATTHEMRRVVGELARGHVPEYGPNGPPKPQDRPKPPG